MAPEDLFAKLKETMGDKTAYEHLNTTKNASIPDIKRAYFSMEKEIRNSPEIKAAYETLTDTSKRKAYDAGLKAEAEQAAAIEASQAIARASASSKAAIADARKFKFSIRNPVVAVGAAIAATASAWVGLQASERASKARDEGEKPSDTDQALKAVGFSGATAIVAAAALMWRAERGQNR